VGTARGRMEPRGGGQQPGMSWDLEVEGSPPSGSTGPVLAEGTAQGRGQQREGTAQRGGRGGARTLPKVGSDPGQLHLHMAETLGP
jgi:hypothetical protein